MNGRSLPRVSDHEWREHRQRIALAIERYREWCEEHGQAWTLTEEDHESA